MRLDEGLADNLGMEPKQAQAFAGGLLLFFEDLFKRQAREKLAGALRRAVPELQEWQTHTPTLPVGAVTAEAVLAHAGSDSGQFELLFMSFGVEPASQVLVKRLLVGFLAERMGSAAIEEIRSSTELLAE